MTDSLVVINGLAGAGKTTLAAELDAPLVSKDVVKEHLADLIGESAIPRSASRALGAAASDAMWATAALVPGLALVESAMVDDAAHRFAERGIALTGARRVVEVWCDVPFELACGRYLARTRHPVHPPGIDEDERERWRHASPIGLGEVLRVDTTAPVDVAALAHRVSQALTRQR